MVKLDVDVLRYMSREEFRVLTAVEMGSKNHEVVPTALIAKIAGLKSGNAFKIIQMLHRNKLLYHDAKKYDGYKLTYQGYDYLALKTFVQRGVIAGLGRRIGVGKESDVFDCVNEKGEKLVLKIHRLGRISFRAIKEKRDYLGHRQSASWQYLSRLAAFREFAYMKALHDHGFPTPTPVDCNRHCVVMSWVDASLLGQLRELRNPDKVYSTLMNMIVRLAEHGLIHCDFNEFNLMVDAKGAVTLIDFPQMVSTSHPNAEELFNRDVQGVRTYFAKRLRFDSDEYPRFFTDTKREVDLDVQLKASGIAKEELKQLDEYLEQTRDLAFDPDQESQDQEENDEVDGDMKAAGGSDQDDHADDDADDGDDAAEEDDDDAAAGSDDADAGDEPADRDTGAAVQGSLSLVSPVRPDIGASARATASAKAAAGAATGASVEAADDVKLHHDIEVGDVPAGSSIADAATDTAQQAVEDSIDREALQAHVRARVAQMGKKQRAQRTYGAALKASRNRVKDKDKAKVRAEIRGNY